MPEELRFDGRVVIVTGAGAGLGRAYALLFGSRGASVVVNDLGGGRHGEGNSSKVADVVVQEIRRLGGKAVPNYDNVLDGDKIVKTAIDAFGRVDIVVNNAGILRDKSFIKMTETDWDLIQNVHVKGSMKTTQAAWPYFRKQNYGRVIFTSSNSGLYGNFGQANYSAAKMGLVGLANTLAIEGAKNNIHTNVIVPTAGSRLTEDIVPPDFFEALKPELIAPIVTWLCHEECTENGSIIESAVGWSGKYHLVRSPGCVLRQNINDMVSPEAVKEKWSEITDMSGATHLNSIAEASGELMNVVEQLKSNQSSSDEEIVVQNYYNYRDVILYALGVGATTQEPEDICYLYENHENFSLLPTYYAVFGPMSCMSSGLLQKYNVDLSRVLHGEQYIQVHKELPTEATVENRFRVQEVLDKGKGAVLLVQYETYDVKTGDKLATSQMSVFAVGSGGFGGPRESKYTIPPIDPPKRRPDKSITQKTTADQAALYRLNGDQNPLHIDPNFSTMMGYPVPILHGLCSFGFAARHVLRAYANGDPKLFKSIKVRFAKPVIPGQTLRTDMWRNGNRIHFETSVLENNTKVISGAYMDLKAVQMPSVMSNPCSATVNLESDGVFAQMKDYIKSHPEEIKKINGVFLYNVTKDGETKAQWTLDLKKGEIYRGEPKSTKADTTLTVDDKDVVQMALGKLNPQMAFMKGKLKIKGNIMLTQKLKTIIDANRAKL